MVKLDGIYFQIHYLPPNPWLFTKTPGLSNLMSLFIRLGKFSHPSTHQSDMDAWGSNERGHGEELHAE